MAEPSSNSLTVRIIGSGLIGTSIGLGLRAHGLAIEMIDTDSKAQLLAQDLVGPKPTNAPDFVIFALASSRLENVLNEEYRLNPNSRFMDTGSIKSKPALKVISSEIPPARFLLSHPMAGREVSGPQSARADLFESRSWIYSSQGVDPDVLSMGLKIIALLGATPIDMAPDEHDRTVALISHLPQVVASLLAKQLMGGQEGSLDLAGAGLRDTVRIAASDPELWSEILTSNSEHIAPLLKNLQSDLTLFMSDLEQGIDLKGWITQGNAGHARIPGKHGGKARAYTALPIVIEDKPGQLAELFNECARVGVNIEDLSIEHSPGQFTGLITLQLSADDANVLEEHLREHGWKVHSPR
jgi:prephenate dehydrogenase